MKVPVSWLKDYVDFEDSIEGLSDKLTFAGLEVEAIETIGSDFSGVVVGLVLLCLPIAIMLAWAFELTPEDRHGCCRP